MADKSFDRTIVRLRERPISSDINQAQSQIDRTTREVLQRVFGARASDSSDALNPVALGFVGDGFKLRPSSPASMTVHVASGVGFRDDGLGNVSGVDGVTGLDDLCSYKPLSLGTSQPIAVPAADGTNPRIDILEVKYDRRVENPLSRDVFDVPSESFLPATVNKTLAFNLEGRTSVNGASAINYKTGSPAGSPVAPSVTSGYSKIAEVLVGAGVTTITANDIIDLRRLLFPGGLMSFGATFTTSATGGAPTNLKVMAPPGVQVVITGVTDGGRFTLYLFAGDILAGTMVVTGGAFEGSSIRELKQFATPTIRAALSGDVSDVQGANSSLPGVGIRVGTPIGIYVGKVTTEATTTQVSAAQAVQVHGLLRY